MGGYQPKVYREQGGSRQVIASGGSLDVESGGEIDVESGGSLKIAGTAISATAAELNKTAGVTAGTVTASKALVVGASKQLSELGVVQFGNGSGGTTAALLHGSGLSSDPTTTATADKNFQGYWTESTATTGDSRGAYIRHYLGAAGSGEALRAYCTASAANVATGGTANGAHISMSLDASASISGQANAARLTLDAAADTRTLNGNLAVAMVESNIATGNTVPASVAFLRVVDTGAVRINTLFRLPNAANGTLLATHTSQTNTHSIKCVSDDGTVYYIPCHSTATGRG